MIRFILNETEIEVALPPGIVLLDFIRYRKNLMGTKIGCREGDCGACTVLAGELTGGEVVYKSMTSCLVPLGNIHNKHIVTIEGINEAGILNPVQQAMADEGATQCGFCTPGFVMSLAGFCLSNKAATKENAIAAIDGNICRCTGYKSIERAAVKVARLLAEGKKDMLPSYFTNIKTKLLALQSKSNGFVNADPEIPKSWLGGGTDLYVQKHDEMTQADIHFLFDEISMKEIKKSGDKCFIGASATVTDLRNSPVIREIFPQFDKYAWLVSSTPIRNMATIAGNFVNASPIGDFTIFFLALDAQLMISDGKTERELPLRKLYKGYKQLDKKPGEFIKQIWFQLPDKNTKFHFEKVSKRTNLDIASVNTAMNISADGDKILSADISAGGVGPVPMYLQKASAFLTNKDISEELFDALMEIVQSEISPISDARGTAEYKRLLLSQLIKAHFIELFPELELI